MHRLLCFLSFPVMASCAVTHDNGFATAAQSHPILNLHLTESSGTATLNGGRPSSENMLEALEKRAQAAEDALESHMSVINAQIHELVSIGSSLMQHSHGRGRAAAYSVPTSRGVPCTAWAQVRSP